MKKKILHVLDLYEEFINIINQSLDTKDQSYSEIIKKILKSKYSWSDILEKENLNLKFYYIFPNFKELQKKWMLENNRKINLSSSEIFLSQLDTIKPDLIFFQGTITLKKIINNLNYKYIFWDGTNLQDLKLAKKSEMVLTNMENAYFFYKKHNIKTEIIDHFFDERVLNYLDINQEKKYNIIFIGSVTNKNHFSRSIFLYDLSQIFKINFFLGEKNSYLRIFLITFYNFIFKQNSLTKCIRYIQSQLFLNKKQAKFYYGLEMYNLIAKSKIVLNYHIDSGKGNNMRVFETTGVRSCLFTNGRYSLEKYFDCEKDIVCFDNVEDAKEKLNNLINNEKAIKEIAKNGHIATLKKNTFRNRKIIFSKIFSNILNIKQS